MSYISQIILASSLFLVCLAKHDEMEVYLEDDLELINMIPGESIIEEVSKTMHIFGKHHVQKEVIATIIRVERKMIYCPAMFNVFTSETCSENVTNLAIPLESDEKILKERKCPITMYCHKGSCDGVTKKECENNDIVDFQAPFVDTEPEVSTSFLYHRCATGFKCTLLDVNVYITLINKTTVSLEGDMFKECEMRLNETRCENSFGWTIHLKEKLKLETKSIAVSCLKGKDETLCWDKEEGNDFFQDKNGWGRIDNNLYMPEMEIVPLDQNHVFGEGMASLKDLKDVYRILQFENLQSSYNLIMLRKELNKIKLLLSSLIYFDFGITTDPLQMYRTHESKILKSNKTHLLLTARITKKNKFSNGNIDTGHSTKTKLFPTNDFSREQFNNKVFRIQHYDEYSLDKMFRSATGSVSGRSSYHFENPFNLLAVLKDIYNYVSPFILMFCFLSQIILIRLFLLKFCLTNQ